MVRTINRELGIYELTEDPDMETVNYISLNEANLIMIKAGTKVSKAMEEIAEMYLQLDEEDRADVFIKAPGCIVDGLAVLNTAIRRRKQEGWEPLPADTDE